MSATTVTTAVTVARLGSDQTSTHLHAAAQAQDKVQRGLLLDVVVSQRAAVLQLLARKNQALLVGRDALLVLRKGGRGFTRLP